MHGRAADEGPSFLRCGSAAVRPKEYTEHCGTVLYTAHRTFLCYDMRQGDPWG